MKKVKGIFVLVTTVIKRVIAVLDFPKDIDDFITFAKAIHQAMSGSSLFSTLSLKIAALDAAITELVKRHTGFKSTPPTYTKAQRDAALTIVQNDLRGLKSDVQTLADADPANAETIITAAGMKVKKQGAINKQDFTAKQGEVSGSVVLIAKGAGKRAAHDWQQSNDGLTWNSLTPTLPANTLISGLVRGTIVKFRHREILKDGPGDWSSPEEVVIS